MAVRRFQPVKATRQAVTLKIALSGPSGAGKTTSAVLLAHGLLRGLHPETDGVDLWSKIAFVDTENGSALYLPGRTLNAAVVGPNGKQTTAYVTIGEFTHIAFEPPYNPEAWIEVLGVAEQAGAEVVILDSLSHEWAGSGGILEIKSNLGASWDNWSKVMPKHQKVIDAIRNSPLHVIACMRVKADWLTESYQDSSGNTKTKPVKVGLKTEQKENAEYEFGVAFRVEHLTHLAHTDKDRTGQFDGGDPAVIGPATGQRLAAWTMSGVTSPGSSYWLASQIDRLRAAVTEEALKGAFAEAWRVGKTLTGDLQVATLAHLKGAYDAARDALVEVGQVSAPAAAPTSDSEAA